MSDLDATCIILMELQVRRKFFIGLNNKQTNSAKALVRRQIGWKSEGSEELRKKQNARAARIVSAALKGKEQKEEDRAIADACMLDLMVIAKALAPCEEARHQIELEMCRIVRKMDIHAWQKSITGFGEKSLAVIIGEAGNLSNYSSDDKLRKRLGLAPFNGKAYSTWRKGGGLTTDDWIVAGYAPRRRAELHAVMEPLFKHQTMRAGPYRAAYDRRRAHTAITHPEWKRMQSHMDGLRIMTQKLVSDLWSEWRGAGLPLPETASTEIPPATSLQDEDHDIHGSDLAEFNMLAEGARP